MPVKGVATTGADLHVYEEVKKALQSLDNPIQKLTGLVTDVTPSMPVRASGVSSLPRLTSDVKNLIMYHCLIHHENLCAKLTNAVTVISKLVNFIRSNDAVA
jgi:hypothetical protein